jgi:hypothetical protein
VSVSASSSSASRKPLATTALARTRSPRRRDPGSNPGPRRRDDTPSRLVHVSCGLTHLGRLDAARPRPSAGRRVDASPRTRDAARRLFLRPPAPRRRLSRERRGGYSSRTTPRRSGRSPIIDRSIVRVRSSPPPRVARRSEGVGGESVIHRFAARPLGFSSRRRRRVFVPVSRRRGSRARPRRAFVRTSLPPHRDGGERSSIHRRAAPSRPSSGVQVPNPVHLSATSKKEKKETCRVSYAGRSRIARAGGRRRVPK